MIYTVLNGTTLQAKCAKAGNLFSHAVTFKSCLLFVQKSQWGKKIIGLFGGCCRVNNKELLWCDQKGLLGTAQNHLHFVWSLAGLEYKAFLFSRLRFLVQIPLYLNRYLRPLYQMMPKSSKWARHTPKPCEFEKRAGKTETSKLWRKQEVKVVRVVGTKVSQQEQQDLVKVDQPWQLVKITFWRPGLKDLKVVM